MTVHTLIFDFPLPRTHTGVALGNGNAGMLVWSNQPGCLNLTVSRNDFWDHRNGGRLREGGTYERLKKAYQSGDPRDMRRVLSPGVEKLWRAGMRPSTLLPGGRFELRLAQNVTLRRAVLDCLRGALKIEVDGSDAGIELILSPYRNLLWIKDEAGIVTDVTARPAWQWVKDEFLRRGFAPPTAVAGQDRFGWVQECPDDPALCALAQRVPGGLALALTLGDDADQAMTQASDLIIAFTRQSQDTFQAESAAWWADYWANVPEITIPSPFFTRFMLYAHYKFACATNPNSPRPAPLQGPWIEEYQFPPWGGDYTFNVNIQQIYTLTFNGNNIDHIMPLFDMLESAPFQETMRHNAKMLLGIDDGLLLSHSVNDRGEQCQIGFSPHSALDQAAAAWLAHLYWLTFQHTGDETFLRERAYPFMSGVMRVYEAMLEERGDGTLWLPLSVSPEYGVTGFGNHRQSGSNASMQLACIHMLVKALNETCRVLGLEPRPVWADIEARLLLFATYEEKGKKRIAIWEGQDLAVCHRHHSHLASIYPFDLTASMSDEQKEAVANAIEHWLRTGMGTWSEWCFPWAAIIEARMGMRDAPLVLLEVWKRVFINEGLATVYLPRFHGITAHRYPDIDKPRETHEIMQLEGTAAGATAIFEMLIHTHGRVIKIFPATPAVWADASFRDVPQPGGFRIGAVRSGGKTQAVDIVSLRGGRITVDVPDRASMILRRSGRDKVVSFPFEMHMSAGETLSLVADNE